MAKLKAPGSLLDRAKNFLWYDLIMGTWLSILLIWNQIFTFKHFDYNALPKRTGQTAILTGGTKGIGFKVLKKLLQLDYSVIFGVRNVDAGQKAIDEIRLEGVKTGRAKCIALDLKSLKSVQKFAQNVLKETDRIDLLVNNAGVMLVPYELTEDGYEVQFQVNHLSHFYLTQLLLPKIKSTSLGRSTNCRVVNVSSLAHNAAWPENIKDASNPKVYSPLRAYADSKVSQVLFAKYLDAQLKSEGAKVNIYSLHPGAVMTDLYMHLPFFEYFHWFKGFLRSPDDGAEVVMYTAISPEIEGQGGLYISSKRKWRPSSVTEDLATQKLLWDVSQKCINGTMHH